MLSSPELLVLNSGFHLYGASSVFDSSDFSAGLTSGDSSIFDRLCSGKLIFVICVSQANAACCLI